MFEDHDHFEGLHETEGLPEPLIDLLAQNLPCALGLHDTEISLPSQEKEKDLLKEDEARFDVKGLSMSGAEENRYDCLDESNRSEEFSQKRTNFQVGNDMKTEQFNVDENLSFKECEFYKYVIGTLNDLSVLNRSHQPKICIESPVSERKKSPNPSDALESLRSLSKMFLEKHGEKVESLNISSQDVHCT